MAKVQVQSGLSAQIGGASAPEKAEARAGGASSGAAALSRWVVPQLPEGFDLGDAVNQAVRHIAGHYQTMLGPEGLRVGLQSGVASPQQGADPVADVSGIQVLEGETGRVMRVYTQADFLTLFAQQRQTTGVVVDGQV